jgi:hypothetical protein
MSKLTLDYVRARLDKFFIIASDRISDKEFGYNPYLKKYELHYRGVIQQHSQAKPLIDEYNKL